MVFSSSLFLFLFLPITLALYYLVKNHRWQNSVLVFMSILFYAWGAPKFLVVFFISLFVNYFLVVAIERTTEQPRRKLLLYIAVVFNLVILVYFKYTNFMIHESNRLFALVGLKGIVWPQILLPIGISFFTFHKISYVIDVYRNRQKGFTNLLDYNLYLLFFPQLIAGPIIRFHEIADQIRERKHTIQLFSEGIIRFASGLSKKVILADTLGIIADKAFQFNPAHLNMTTAWLGIICYAFQIFFDFSGYSDMAIGLGEMFGFNLPENFNRPYISGSITEFWRRWHMSLSRFFKDYVYIPLGGNRVSKGRQYLNLWIVFLICGFWHGANWTFVVWGVYFGILLVMERLFLAKLLSKIPALFGRAYTFILVLIGWVLFRSAHLHNAFQYLKTMFTPGTSRILMNSSVLNTKVIVTFLLAAAISFIPYNKEGELAVKLKKSSLIQGCAALFLLVYSILVISNSSFSPFIYFQF